MRLKVLIITLILYLINNVFSQDDLGRKYYESAMAYLRSGNYKQAIEDFEAIIKSLPDSAYADDALLELGKYYLERESNKEKAENYFSILKEKYVKTENGPAGYYYLGRTNLLLGATIEDLNNAYANFERIPILFPKSKWVQQSLHDAGLVQSYLGNYTKGIALLTQAIEKFPKTLYTDLAKLEISICYLNAGKISIALDYVQQVIDNPFDEDVRELAKDYLSFVFRLGFRNVTPGLNLYEKDNSFSFSTNVRKPKQIIYRSDLKLFYVLDEESKSIISLDRNGKIKESKIADKPQSFFLDNKGKIYVVSKKNILTPDDRLLQFSFIYELKTKFIINMKEAASDSEGNYYIIDNTHKGVFKYDNQGNEIEFPLHRVNDRYKKIIIDKRDRLILSLEDRAILIYKKNAELLHRIDTFQGKNFKEICDMGYDKFGYFYILDKDLKAVFIYNTVFKEAAAYYFPENVEPIAFSVGEGGDLFIINKKTKSIEHYR